MPWDESKKGGRSPPVLFAGWCVGCEIELRMIDRGELHLAPSDRNHLELLAIESPAGSHANRRSGGVFRLDGLNHVAPIREGVSNDGVDAHVGISGFVFEHERQHRDLRVPRPAVKFHWVGVTPDDDLEMDRVGVVFLRVDGVSCHRPDVVQDTGEVFSVADGLIDDGPNRIGAGHGHFPLLLNDFELGEVDEDTVGDGLLATVGKDDWTERIVVFLHFELPPGSCWIGPLWTVIPYCRLADFRHARSQVLTKCRGGGHRNEGETQGLARRWSAEQLP